MSSRKGVKNSSGWTLLDENIENVERLKLDLETQRKLGCLVGENVSLEYPWVFVSREILERHSRLSESPLAPFREKIRTCEADTLLIGYSSSRLTSCDFVLCLTEEANRVVSQRNGEITWNMLKNVARKTEKWPSPWKSLGSEREVEETFSKDSRRLIEVEITLAGKYLASNRRLSDRNSNDCRDGYMELVNTHDTFDNIDRKCISRTTQTHLEARSVVAQTHSSYSRNAWTQYVYEDTLGEENSKDDLEEDEEKLGEESEKRSEEKIEEKKDTASDPKTDENGEPREKSPCEIFLESRAPQVLDLVQYNAAINLHVDDIENLSKKDLEEVSIVEEFDLQEQVSFVDLSTNNRVVSDVSWHPNLPEYVAVSYLSSSIFNSPRSFSSNGSMNELKFESRVLVWSQQDPLRPRLALQDHREICSISFCPFNENVLIGGCSTGQVIVYNAKDRLSGRNHEIKGKHVELRTPTETDVPMVRAIVVSDKHRSHRMSVRKIRWMPANYRIEPNGKLTRLSTFTNVQFLTASEDGTVAVWDLSSLDFANLDNPLTPIYRFKIPSSKESRNLPLLCLCLPSIGVLEEREGYQRRSTELNSKEMDYLKSMWIGTAEGLMRYTWTGETFEPETANFEECKISSLSRLHDGPVTEIQRSPHLEDVLLTIGGRVLAIWKDDYLDSPLFWRRTTRRYTACCWSNEPGVFFVGGYDGVLEMWDVEVDSGRPILERTISSKSITGLFLRKATDRISAIIGVGDANGVLRIFEEPGQAKVDSIGRMDWFEEFVWREVRRKKVFSSWQTDFLANDPGALARQSARLEEERRKKSVEAREKLQRKHEERLRLDAERKARSAPKPKDVVWKMSEYERMKNVLLEKKNLIPSELEQKRLPMVLRNQEREEKLSKAQQEVARREKYFEDALLLEFPEILVETSEDLETEDTIGSKKSTEDFMQEFFQVRDDARKILNAYSSISGRKLEKRQEKAKRE